MYKQVEVTASYSLKTISGCVEALPLSSIILKNFQAYFKDLTVLIQQDFKVCLAIFQHYALNGLSAIFRGCFVMSSHVNVIFFAL